MTHEITNCRRVEQQVLQKNSERAPRPSSALARNDAAPSQARVALTVRSGLATAALNAIDLRAQKIIAQRVAARHGGYVYRGAAIPALRAIPVFRPLHRFCPSLEPPEQRRDSHRGAELNVGTPFSFGQDGFGEVYVLTAENRV